MLSEEGCPISDIILAGRPPLSPCKNPQDFLLHSTNTPVDFRITSRISHGPLFASSWMTSFIKSLVFATPTPQRAPLSSATSTQSR